MCKGYIGTHVRSNVISRQRHNFKVFDIKAFLVGTSGKLTDLYNLGL